MRNFGFSDVINFFLYSHSLQLFYNYHKLKKSWNMHTKFKLACC